MSWEHRHYRATCKSCGKEGEQIQSSDDWNRHETTWVGFQLAPLSERVKYVIATARRGRADFVVCECGSRVIEVGPWLYDS